MKNMHQFYLVTFLLSLNSVIFYAQAIKTTIQQQSKKTNFSQEDWAITTRNLGSSTEQKHRDAISTNHEKKAATVFPKIDAIPTQQHHNNQSFSTGSCEHTKLPLIKNKAINVHDSITTDILNDLEAQLSESTHVISGNILHNLFTITEDMKNLHVTESGDEDEYEDEDEDGELLKRKALRSQSGKRTQLTNLDS